MTAKKTKPKKTKPKKRRASTPRATEWVAMIDDAGTQARMSVDRGGGVVVFFLHPDGGHLAALGMEPINACQLGMALVDASKAAGAERRKLEAALARKADPGV